MSSTNHQHSESSTFAAMVAANWTTGEETAAETAQVDAYVAEAAAAMTDGQ